MSSLELSESDLISRMRALTDETRIDHRTHNVQLGLVHLFDFSATAKDGVHDVRFNVKPTARVLDGDMLVKGATSYVLFDVKKAPGYNSTYLARAHPSDPENGIGHAVEPRCPDLRALSFARRHG